MNGYKSMKPLVNTITVVSYVVFGLILTSIVPGAMSAAEALAVRGASDPVGCATTGPCPSCTSHTCNTVRVAADTTACLPNPFGTNGCSLAAAGFMSKCAALPAGTGCTPITAPAVGSCGSLVVPLACPSIPALAPVRGTVCDQAIPPSCGPSPGAPAICNVCF